MGGICGQTATPIGYEVKGSYASGCLIMNMAGAFGLAWGRKRKLKKGKMGLKGLRLSRWRIARYSLGGQDFCCPLLQVFLPGLSDRRVSVHRLDEPVCPLDSLLMRYPWIGYGLEHFFES